MKKNSGERKGVYARESNLVVYAQIMCIVTRGLSSVSSLGSTTDPYRRQQAIHP